MSSLALLMSEAETALVQRNIDAAAELFSRAEALNPRKFPEPQIGIARVALLLGRAADAGQLLDDVLLRFPRCALAVTCRGLVDEASGDLEGALVRHEHAVQLDATFALAHLNAGRVAAQLTNWERAEAHFQVAIQLGASGPEVEVMWGTALFRARRPAEALKRLGDTVRRYPDHLDATVTLVDVLVEAGRLDLATALLMNAAPRFPSEPVLAAKHAAIALRQKDLEAAAREAQRHTLLAPKDEEAWLFLAVLDTMRLDFARAEKSLRRAIALNPLNWRPHHHLGGLFNALRKPALAKAAFRRAITLNSHAWQPVNDLAVLLLEDGTRERVDEARILLEAAARRGVNGESLALRYNLTLAYLALGANEAARRSAQELFDLAPADHPFAHEAKRVLRAA